MQLRNSSVFFFFMGGKDAFESENRKKYSRKGKFSNSPPLNAYISISSTVWTIEPVLSSIVNVLFKIGGIHFCRFKRLPVCTFTYFSVCVHVHVRARVRVRATSLSTSKTMSLLMLLFIFQVSVHFSGF